MILQTREEYIARQALNYSGLRELLKSPLHYRQYLDRPREETKALRVGSATHALALQGAEAYAAGFAIAPDVDKRTKDGREAWAAFASENAGKTILTAEEGETVRAVALAARDAMVALGIVGIFAEHMLTADYNGVPLKAAIDLVARDRDGNLVLVDLKTTEDASPRGFLNSVRSYRYNLQAHVYRTVYALAGAMEGPIPPRFLFLAVEKESLATAWYEIGPGLAAYAVEDFERGVKLYDECRALDSWPGYSQDPQVLDIGSTPTAATSITFA